MAHTLSHHDSSRLLWLVAAALLGVCLFDVADGASCPPNVAECIKIDLLPSTNGFSNHCEVVKDDNIPGGVGWQYDDDYTFMGWGNAPFPNSQTASPVDGHKRRVE